MITTVGCGDCLNRGDGFEAEDGGSRFVRFFKIEGKVERPVVEVVGVDEGMVDGEAVSGEVGVAKTILEIGHGLGKLLR